MPKAQQSQNQQVYETATEAGTLRVTILNEPCTDDMSGTLFEQTVTIVMNGKTYEGCGKYLVFKNR